MALRLWANAQTAQDLHFAITISALEIQEELNSETDIRETRIFVLGPSFLESLRKCQCLREGRFALVTRTICAQIVAKVCTKKIGPMGRPDQIIRAYDGAKGWRVHLTKGAEGLRLMYWDNGKQIEFANVGVKHELEIVHGSSGSEIGVNVREYF